MSDLPTFLAGKMSVVYVICGNFLNVDNLIEYLTLTYSSNCVKEYICFLLQDQPMDSVLSSMWRNMTTC